MLCKARLPRLVFDDLVWFRLSLRDGVVCLTLDTRAETVAECHEKYVVGFEPWVPKIVCFDLCHGALVSGLCVEAEGRG